MNRKDTARRGISRLAILLIVAAAAIFVGSVFFMMVWATREVHQAARISASKSGLRQIGLALHTYAGDHRDLFPGDVMSDSGKSLLSWRVAILPYIEQTELYEAFKLDEPWDSPHNKRLLAEMPAIYASPLSQVDLASDHKTVYLRPTGSGLAMDSHKSVGLEMPDGTSNTVIAVEANDSHAVPWTKPDDLPYDPKTPLAGLVGQLGDGFLALFADVSVLKMSTGIAPKAWHAMLTRSGRERIDRTRWEAKKKL
jgi:hypothetical protein